MQKKFSFAATLAGLVLAAGGLILYSHPGLTADPGYQNEVQWQERDGFRTMTSNGIPDHEVGQFPGPGNPSRIAPQQFNFRMTLNPKIAAKPFFNQNGKFGFVLNGVPLDPGTNEWWNGDRRSGWQEVAHAGTSELGLDQSNAHVQPDGTYHYHGLPYGWLNKLPDAAKPQIVLTGYAADGFPIYSLFGYADAKNPDSKIVKLHSSWRLKTGERPDGPGGEYDGTYTKDYEYVAGAGDLDECNGRFGVTPEYPNGIYYYVLTEEFPYIPRYFKGTPDASFLRRPGSPPMPGDGRGRGPNGRRPPPPFGGPPPDGPPDR